MALCVQLLSLTLVEETSPAWIIFQAQWTETQSDLTQLAQHTEYFHSDPANLTPGVSQQTGVKLKKTGDRSLWVCARQGLAASFNLFP